VTVVQKWTTPTGCTQYEVNEVGSRELNKIHQLQFHSSNNLVMPYTLFQQTANCKTMIRNM